METRAWLFDLYPLDSRMVLWFLTAAGRHLRVTDAFTYRLYAQGSEPALLQLAAEVARRGWIKQSYLDDKIDFATGRTQVVLCLELQAYHYLPRLLACLGTLEGFSFGNCDLDLPSYYLYLNKIFPCSWYDLTIKGDVLQSLTLREDPFQDELTLPPLNTLELSLTRDHLIPLGAGNSLSCTWEGRTIEMEADDPSALVSEVSRYLTNADPDLIISDWGDERILPRLWQWSQRHRLKLPLDREPRPVSRPVDTRGRSYFSYGRIVYQGSSVPCYGRWHVDRRNSFFYREAGLAGLAQLARIGQMPLQKLARTSPGTLITSMQLARAVADNILIPWRKGEPERFKTALELLTTDKGGLVFQPPVGFHTQVAEIDFASMYPTIMAIHNISPETIDCGCCSGPRAPEAGYVLCQRREGLVPRTLKPILNLRARLKVRAQQAADPEVAAEFTARQSALKWILVTCFGYLGYKNARFGRIEAHEAVTAYGRDKLLTAKEVCESAGFQVLHGLTDCLWIKRRGGGPGSQQGPSAPCPLPGKFLPTKVLRGYDFASELQLLCDQITAATGVTMALEGVYRWVVFLPSYQQADRPVPNRYFGVFEDGKLKYRGLMCRRRDTPPLVRQAQQDLLGRLAQAANREEAVTMGPELQDLLIEYTARLEQGRVEPRDLVITKVLSRPVEQYRVETHTALAAKQLAATGVALVPGEKVRYVVRERHGPPEIRVLAAPFLDTLDRYDSAYYLELLDRAVNEVLGPFNEF